MRIDEITVEVKNKQMEKLFNAKHGKIFAVVKKHYPNAIIKRSNIDIIIDKGAVHKIQKIAYANHLRFDLKLWNDKKFTFLIGRNFQQASSYVKSTDIPKLIELIKELPINAFIFDQIQGVFNKDKMIDHLILKIVKLILVRRYGKYGVKQLSSEDKELVYQSIFDQVKAGDLVYEN